MSCRNPQAKVCEEEGERNYESSGDERGDRKYQGRAPQQTKPTFNSSSHSTGEESPLIKGRLTNLRTCS